MPSSSSAPPQGRNDDNDEPDVIVERQSGLFHYVYSGSSADQNNNDGDEDTTKANNSVNRLDYHYSIGQPIGIGIGHQQQQHDSSGVRICRHKRTGQKRVLKILSKRYVTPTKFHSEIKALRQVDHPNVLRLYESFENDSYYYIVTELSTAGNLYDYLTSHYAILNEIDFASIMKTLLICINHCHALNIIHGDVKPENILMEKDDYGNNNNRKSYDRLILADFGVSQFYENNSKNRRLGGTPLFWSPEVFRNQLGPKADIWSCGVIAYVLLTAGRFPFEGSNTVDEVQNAREIYQQIKQRTDHFELEIWNHRTPESKSFVQQLLTINETDRPTAQEALQHPWFEIIDNKYSNNTQEEDPTATSSMMMIQQLPALEKLIQFSAKQKMKQATYSYLVAHRINKKRRKLLDKIFRHVDTNSDGLLSRTEIEIAFRTEQQKGYHHNSSFLLCSPEELMDIFQRVDMDQNGYINYWEFLSATILSDSLLCEENLRLAFDAFDRNNSGTITAEEVKELFFSSIHHQQQPTSTTSTAKPEGAEAGGGGEDLISGNDDDDEEGGGGGGRSRSSKSDTDRIIASIIQQVDKNGDGVICYDEFAKMMQENLLSSVLSQKRLSSSSSSDDESATTDDDDESDENIAPPLRRRQRSC